MTKLSQSMKMLTVAIIAFTLSISFGCGNKKPPIAKVKPEKVEISGDLADNIQVVDNEYEVSGDWGGDISIKVKGIKPLSEEELSGNDFDLSASMLGENGVPVSGTGAFTLTYSSKDKLLALLKNGTGEEVVQLKAELGDYLASEHADKCKMFSVSSTMKQKKGSTASSTDNTDNSNSSLNETTSAVGSENWNKILSDYDSFITLYISLMKKAKSGDMSAMGEYADAMQKAQELGDKLQSAQNDLSPAQAAKFVKLQSKLSEAALQMAGQ